MVEYLVANQIVVGSSPITRSTFNQEKGYEMYLEPIAAMSIAIFLSVTMFFAMYLTAYAIVSGALFTAKKIKLKIYQDKKEEDNL